jgi:hypothetical protein
MRSPEEVVMLCKSLAIRFLRLSKQLAAVRIHPVRLRAVREGLGQIDYELTQIERVIKHGSKKEVCKNV